VFSSDLTAIQYIYICHLVFGESAASF